MDTAAVRQLPPTLGTGLCVCGVAYYYERAERVGEVGHFHCRRCGRRYRMYDADPWVPGAPPQSSSSR